MPIKRIFKGLRVTFLGMTVKTGKQESKPRRAGRFRIGEFARPEVRWIEDAKCPICGSEELMDALGMALCVPCNKFVKPKKNR
jgi:hypothetical protein